MSPQNSIFYKILTRGFVRVLFISVAAVILFVGLQFNTPSIGPPFVQSAFADGGGDGGSFTKYKSKKKKTSKRSRTRVKKTEKKVAKKKARKRSKKARKKPVKKSRYELTAVQLKQELKLANKKLTRNGRTIHQQVEDQKSAIYHLESTIDAVDELIVELEKIQVEQKALGKDVENWSANPYGKGRIKDKAKTKTILTGLAAIITGKINPIGIIAGFVADGIEGVGRWHYKSAAREAITAGSKSLNASLRKAYKASLRMSKQLTKERVQLKVLLYESDAVHNLFLRLWRQTLREAQKNKRATNSAVLERVQDIEGDRKIYRRYRKEQLRRLRKYGVTRCKY